MEVITSDMKTEFMSDIVSDQNLMMLENDIHIILKLFESQSELTMQDIVQNYSLHLRPGVYTNSTNLYKDMISILKYLDFGNSLLELMPYIDDYIEIYFK
jgi:hypothetical protein